jgi:hypothetical protein
MGGLPCAAGTTLASCANVMDGQNNCGVCHIAITGRAANPLKL